MKIAYILPSIINKGSITVFKDLIMNIEEKHPEIEVDIFYFNNHDEKYFDRTYLRKIKFTDKINLSKYDIIHSSGIVPNFYVFLRKKFYKSIFLTTIHSYLKEDIYNSFKKIPAFFIYNFWLKILSSQDCIVVLSTDAKKYYSKKINTKIEVVNNGRSNFKKKEIIISDDEEIEKIHSIKKDYKIIGTNAIISKIKGLEQILYFLISNKDFYFVLVGDGPEKENLIDLSKQLEVYDRCFFVDFKENIYEYTRLYDIYVMPSRSEGFGMALIEAVSIGIPCVCSDIPVFRELFNDNEIIFFELDNIDDLSIKIKKCIAESEKLKTNSQKKYLNKFTSEVMTKNYIALYNKLLKI